jgi:hypothetical protein
MQRCIPHPGGRGLLVVAKLEFEGQGDAIATFMLTPDGGGTRVVWGSETENGMNPPSCGFELMGDRRSAAMTRRASRSPGT